ncbi:hypothetical protein EV421DRAFT_1909617 [Armillaria borealis]|uniref:Uncharacterized protein n=1 Tax=Armillaria borealis TaxID=47425 RepID=A0AA39J2K3_9AGAR|nr:hypothetical protein EV421DRAFT_1909617 [Armillaria borealis]
MSDSRARARGHSATRGGHAHGHGGGGDGGDGTSHGGGTATDVAPQRMATHAENSSKHPGLVNAKGVRRTSEQIRADEAAAEAELAEHEAAVLKDHQGTVAAAAAFQAHLEAEDAHRRLTANCPDLASHHGRHLVGVLVTTTADGTWEVTSPAKASDSVSRSSTSMPEFYAAINAEEQAVCGQETTVSGDVDMPSVQEVTEVEGEGEDEGEYDDEASDEYHPEDNGETAGYNGAAGDDEAEVEISADIASKKKQKKKRVIKAPHGQLHAEIQAVSSASSSNVVGTLKRKQVLPVSGIIDEEDPKMVTWKRAKTADVGGLPTNWQSRVPPPQSLPAPGFQQNLRTTANPTGLQSANNENAAALKKVFTHKKTTLKADTTTAQWAPFVVPLPATPNTPVLDPTPALTPTLVPVPVQGSAQGNTISCKSGIARSTAQMGLVLEKAPVTAAPTLPSRGHTARGKLTMADLPFPSGQVTVYWKKWSNEFVPGIVTWAGCTVDPFGTNAHEKFEITVGTLFTNVFPELAHKHQEPAIIALAGQALAEWRSKIGKLALKAVKECWDEGSTPETIAETVGSYLPVPSFIYDQPKSNLLLEVYAEHLVTSLKCQWDFGQSVGAMALCASAVEHALMCWKTGTNALEAR